MDLNNELKRINSVIDMEFKNIFKDKDVYQKRIIETIDYSLFTGGKRLRPIMAIKSYELFKDDIEEILPYAVAIEMIHTYSLIHDDLPSMDDDDFRRGKPTSHKVFGEAMAILAGDGLLNLAFETMADHIDKKAKTIEDYKKYTKAFKEISGYSGIYGMIGGQVVDLLATHNTMSEEKLLFMYKTKTAALIQSALVTGAIIGEASDIEVEAMREFGLNLGLAYQIRDDILDINQDKIIKKLTYLSFHDLDRAKIAVEEYSNKAMNSLKGLNNRNTDFFVALTEELISRDK
ncbi:polyprenyl synthetase family protein [Tissierella pigra]|uniref:Farnesyl diphosphate synthase n=1 Tax=Tissierella pigra TaxID=2607614 RepID=A0A6N7XR74_9FIRM|nr:polyprenyl synthetase family protein [Tissierella pigra]MBU5426657.1 polyprenyl synthetase family protein [Tissierella pigra]MST99902.1 polyprenyl synthetase family protein [Tissierella pigra]